jgi:hypothetical protein
MLEMLFYGGKMTQDNFYDPEKNFNPFFGTLENNFENWLSLGIENGWVSRPVCSTHDGIPTTHAEDLEWEEGGDPCIYAVRLFSDENERALVIENIGGPL